MKREQKREKNQRRNQDHRPMIPELSNPEDSVDIAVRNVRRRYDDINPTDYLKWR